MALAGSVAGFPTAVAAAPARPAVRAPGDSVQGAIRGLAEARGRVTALDARRVQLLYRAAQERQIADRRERERRAEEQHRSHRAAAMYRQTSQAVPLAPPAGDQLDQDRVGELFAAGDRRSRRRIRDLRAETAYRRAAADAADGERHGVETELVTAIEVRDTLAEKLANSGGAIAAIRPPAPISAAGTTVAQRADRAAAALRATRGDLWNQDPAWLEARHALTTVLVGSGGVGSASTVGMELEWDTVPKPALIAVLGALRQVGRPYVYATAGPSTFDCSGLTKRAYAEAGFGIPHFSASQLRLGAPVRRDQMRAGDLIAYGPGGADHVAMYIGVGIAVEARGSADRVVVNPARTSGSFAGATRIVP